MKRIGFCDSVQGSRTLLLIKVSIIYAGKKFYDIEPCKNVILTKSPFLSSEKKHFIIEFEAREREGEREMKREREREEDKERDRERERNRKIKVGIVRGTDR